jgi:hypothetical protein
MACGVDDLLTELMGSFILSQLVAGLTWNDGGLMQSYYCRY